MTRDGMTPERFEVLAEAFGGDVARWPEAERDAAAAVMAAVPDWAGRVLARADQLDAMLRAFPAPQVGGDLAERIAAGARRPRPRWRGWLLPAGMGAGLAAACAAGLMLGVQLGGAPEGGEGQMTAVDDEFSLYLDEAAG